MKKSRVAVIGVGYLGQYHAEKYQKLPEAELVAVCDIDQSRAEKVAQSCETKAIYDYRDLSGKVDAVSIVVPTTAHFEVAKFFLQQGIHVLLEKPIAVTLKEADDLIQLAKQKQSILQIGHLERFNSAFTAAKEFVIEPKFIEAYRLAPFKPRCTDVDVTLDLMIHDIDLILHLVKAPIKNIHANGASVLTDDIDIVNARIEFTNCSVANLTASRVSFRQERKLRIFQPDTYINIDLQSPKFSVHSKGQQEVFPGIPEIISEEKSFAENDSLLVEIKAFLQAIQQKITPQVTGEDGRSALETSIAINKLIARQLLPERTEV